MFAYICVSISGSLCFVCRAGQRSDGNSRILYVTHTYIHTYSLFFFQARSASSVGLVKDLMEIAGYCDFIQVRASGAGDALANGVYRFVHVYVCARVCVYVCVYVCVLYVTNF